MSNRSELRFSAGTGSLLTRFGAVLAGIGTFGLGLVARAESLEVVDEVLEAEHHSGGLPQLNPDSFASQIFWMLLVFAALYYMLQRRILPRFAEVLEEREVKITGDLSRAEELRAEAEAAEASYEASLAEARATAHDALAKAQEHAAEETAKKMAKVDSSIKGRFTKAENKLTEQKQEAYGQLASIVSEAVNDSVGRIAGFSPDQKAVEAAVKKALEARS